MRLYIIRHADPDYENNTITEDGHKEAVALSKRLASQGLDKIYCSPLGRAIDTAKYTCELLDLQYNIENWTKEHGSECFIEGTPWGRIFSINIPGEVFRGNDTMPTQDNWHQIPIFSDTNIRETFENIKKDSDDFLKRLGFEREGGRYKILRPNEDKVAVFCHGGFGLTWLAHLLEIPVTLMWSGFWLPTSSVTTILFDERSPGYAVPRCIGLGDVSHLYTEGLPVKPRGIVANYY